MELKSQDLGNTMTKLNISRALIETIEIGISEATVSNISIFSKSVKGY